MTMPPLLELRAISRRFGGLQALEDVSFGLQEGEIFGLIGPNGAGKTTLFNIITGGTQPSGGQVLWTQAGIQVLPPPRTPPPARPPYSPNLRPVQTPPVPPTRAPSVRPSCCGGINHVNWPQILGPDKVCNCFLALCN